ncbi:Allantoinase [Abeliophyllum distichum]|uniref:Allantoinase n=1 Tax=Abeliophyllum distichum TaxID=126358 RepID=A0ABD1V6B4_9LAMI
MEKSKRLAFKIWITQYKDFHVLKSGGIRTLIDMPLNSFPSTVSKETLKLKYVISTSSFNRFLGRSGPKNAFNATSLERLLKAGVLGLKSFMCPSGINDFPMTNSSHIKV